MRSCIWIVALLTSALGWDGALAAHPHERTGFLIGFDLGGGSAQVDWEVDDVTLSSDRESGGAGNFRIGYATRPDLAIALEATGWTRTYDVEGTAFEVTTSFSVVGPSLTWYPEAGGFFVRGTIGSGRVRVEFSGDGISIVGEDHGLGAAIAGGYEWRLTRRFALGVQADLGAIDVGEVTSEDGSTSDLKVDFANLTAAFNWYW